MCRRYELCRTELQATFARANSTCGGVSNDDGSITRSQALERFGIDLGRVGVMTSACTASRHSLIDGSSGGDQDPARGGVGEQVAEATNASSEVDRIGRGRGEQRANRTEIKGGSGGSSGATTVNKGKSNNSSTGVGARRQESISEKLKVLDKLLSDDLLCQMPADTTRKGKRKTTKTSMQWKEDYSTGVSERTGAENNASVDIIVDLSNDGDDNGGKSRLDVSSSENIACGAEPKEATTVAEEEGEKEGVADPSDGALQGNVTVKKVIDVERHHYHKEALPNHR